MTDALNTPLTTPLTTPPTAMGRDMIFIVTGLSGAGLSSALKILEDMGCDVFDNFPLQLLEPLLQQQKPHHRPIALGMDTRTRDFNPEEILAAIENLRGTGEWAVRSFFLTADDGALLKRFTETRRTHPLARDRAIADGIATEKSLLYPLKYKADSVIDTSEFSIHDLRRVIEAKVEGLRSNRMNIGVMSFAYRHGVPREADLVFDMRFLHNPNWIAELKDLTGREKIVQDYIERDTGFTPFVENLSRMLEGIIPGYIHGGKTYLTIAFGCTGGRHRSVCMAEKTKLWLEQKGFPVSVHHRELKSEIKSRTASETA